MKSKLFLFAGLFLCASLSMQGQMPEDPAVIFETNTGRVFESGSATTLRLKLAFKTAGKVYIDWGDGNVGNPIICNDEEAIYDGTAKAPASNPEAITSTVKIYKEKGEEETDQDNDLIKIDYRGTTTSNHGGLTMFDSSGAGDFLENINLDRNQLASINVSKNTNLKSLTVSYNKLTEVDLTNNPNLTGIYLRDNLLSSLDVSKNQQLTAITLNGNTPFVDPCAYNAFYESLPDLQGKKGNFVISSANQGVLTSKTSIAYDKGWTINGGNTINGDETGCPSTNNREIIESATSLLLADGVLSFTSGATGSICLMDTSGKTILRLENVNSLNISTLAKGLYFVRYEVDGIAKATKIINQ